MRRLAGWIAAWAALTLLLAGCGSGDAGPASGAARLVPAGALVYLNLSTDGSRDAVGQAGRLAAAFPSYARVRDLIFSRLSATGPGVDMQSRVRPWLGREAAVALLDTGGPTAGSLVVIDVTDRSRASAFLEPPQAPGTVYAGITVRQVGAVSVAFVGHYAVIGQDATVRRAIDLAAGRGLSLAQTPAFIAAGRGLPTNRVVGGFLTAAGVRRLLAPHSGLLGIAGTLLNHPGLRAAGVALTPAVRGVRLSVHEILDPAQERSAAPPFRPFTPALAQTVPANALAYLGAAGLDQALTRLLGATGRSGAALGALLTRARTNLSPIDALTLSSTIRTVLGGEVAIWVTAGTPPALAVLTRVDDEAGTRLELARLQQPLARLLRPPSAGPGQAPTFDQRQVNGIEITSLRLAPGLELDYGVRSHHLVIATGVAPIVAALGSGRHLPDMPAYARVLSGHPSRVTSLLFLDFSQLLSLGEQTGLSSSAAYARIRDDLKRVQAVGESSAGGEGQTTAEIFLSTP